MLYGSTPLNTPPLPGWNGRPSRMYSGVLVRSANDVAPRICTAICPSPVRDTSKPGTLPWSIFSIGSWACFAMSSDVTVLTSFGCGADLGLLPPHPAAIEKNRTANALLFRTCFSLGRFRHDRVERRRNRMTVEDRGQRDPEQPHRRDRGVHRFDVLQF